MKKKLNLIILLIISLTECKTVIDINIPEEPPELVINSTLIAGEYFKVNLSQSQHILNEKDFEPVSGATVDIYENGTFLTTLPDSAKGNYISATYKPQKGGNYKITVSKKGFKDASAQVIIPLHSPSVKDVKLDTIEVIEVDKTVTYLRFDIELKDNINTENYYDISIVKTSWYYDYNNNLIPPALIDSGFVTSQLFLETKDLGLEEFQSYGQHIIFNDNLFNGKTYHINILSDLYNEDAGMYDEAGKTTFSIKVANTSQSYYLYEISTMLQNWTQGDLLAEPVQVYNNINNGYGVFGAINASTTILEYH